MTVDEALVRSDRTLHDLWNIYAGPMTSIGPRSQPVWAYAAFAFELQEAMGVLIRQNLVGAAMTFPRAIFESPCRAGWVLGCATDAQVQDLRDSDRFKFPAMKDMA